MTNTKEAILESGLRILNTKGLSALSTRAVADDLALSPGNVSYHFPRKERLVFALVKRQGEHNEDRLRRDITTIADFLEMFRDLFRGQLRVRGLLLALPDIMETFAEIRQHYRRVEKARRQRLLRLLAGLRERGVLVAKDRDLSRLVSHITFVARFWIAEARVSYANHGEQRVVGHYLALIADTVVPHASASARADLEPYLDGWLESVELPD